MDSSAQFEDIHLLEQKLENTNLPKELATKAKAMIDRLLRMAQTQGYSQEYDLVKVAGVNSVDGYVDAVFGKGSSRSLSGAPVGRYERFGVLEGIDKDGKKFVFKEHFGDHFVASPIYIADPGTEKRVADVRKALVTVDDRLRRIAEQLPGVSTTIKYKFSTAPNAISSASKVKSNFVCKVWLIKHT